LKGLVLEKLGRASSDRFPHLRLKVGDISPLILGRKAAKLVHRNVRGHSDSSLAVGGAFAFIGSADRAEYVIALDERRGFIIDELQVTGLRSWYRIRSDRKVQHRCTPARLDGLFDIVKLAIHLGLRHRSKRMRQHIGHDRLGAVLSSPRIYTPSATLAAKPVNSIRKQDRAARPPDRVGQTPCEVSDTSVYVAGASKEVVHGRHRKRRFCFSSTGLHRDLTYGVEVGSQWFPAGKTGCGDYVRQRASHPPQDGSIGHRTSEMTQNRTSIQRG